MSTGYGSQSQMRVQSQPENWKVLQELQRNSNCKGLSRNEKNQITAEISDVWKTKSRELDKY